MKSYYGEPIGTHQCSFERYHPRPYTASPSRKLWVRNTNPKLQSLLSHERVKLRTTNLPHTFTGSIRTKAHEKFGRKGIERGHIQGLPKFFEYPLLSTFCRLRLRRQCGRDLMVKLQNKVGNVLYFLYTTFSANNSRPYIENLYDNGK